MRTRSARSSTVSSCGVQRADQLAEVARPPVDRLEDDGDAVPLGVARRQRLQRRDRLRLSGRPFQHLGVAIDRRDDVIQPLVLDPGEAQPGRVAFARVADAIQGGGQVIGQLVPLPLRAEQPFQLRGGRRDRRGRRPSPRAASRSRARGCPASPRRASRSGAAAPASPPDRRRARPPRRSARAAPARRPSAPAPPRTVCATSRSSGRASNSRR